MMTETRIKNDQLIFYIPCTASSGYMNGSVHVEKIISPKKIALIKKSQAYWKDPDGKLILLPIEPVKKEAELDRIRIRH